MANSVIVTIPVALTKHCNLVNSIVPVVTPLIRIFTALVTGLLMGRDMNRIIIIAYAVL